MAYDFLREDYGIKSGNKQYLKILNLAARRSETLVNNTLKHFLSKGDSITFEAVEACVSSLQKPPAITQVHIEPINLNTYDSLLDTSREACA